MPRLQNKKYVCRLKSHVRTTAVLETVSFSLLDSKHLWFKYIKNINLVCLVLS